MKCLRLLLVLCAYGAHTPVFAADPPPAETKPAPANTPTAARPAAASDRLTLEATTVTGNRELPKVLYIVPWKKADIGNLPGQPFNTLLDETLTPVDRDVFRREVDYYEAITAKPAAAADATK